MTDNIVLKIGGKIHIYFRKLYVRKEPFPFSGNVTLVSACSL